MFGKSAFGVLVGTKRRVFKALNHNKNMQTQDWSHGTHWVLFTRCPFLLPKGLFFTAVRACSQEKA
eukprot:83831-Amphidinium_carterae.1